MQSPTFQFPNFESLTTGLTSVFYRSGATNGPVTILDRQPNAYASTFPSEIVTCKSHDERELRVFCKYGVGYFSRIFGHRRGVPYEVEVYLEVLNKLKGSTPSFFGSFTDKTTGTACLVAEYLDSSLRLDLTPEPDAMELVAHWLGQFHAANEACFSSSSPMSFLNIYDAEYYSAWGSQFSVIPDHFWQSFQWLSVLYERSVAFMTPLLVVAPTIIHGECYPNNVLIRNGQVFAVDWESAGIGAGEIDLAALTQGKWSREIIQECELEYQRARWPEGTPDQFDQTLAAARLYFHFQLLFHWLKFQPERPAQETWLFEELHSAGERLGLL